MEYTVIIYLFDKGETVSEGICFTSQSKVTGLVIEYGKWASKWLEMRSQIHRF